MVRNEKSIVLINNHVSTSMASILSSKLVDCVYMALMMFLGINFGQPWSYSLAVIAALNIIFAILYIIRILSTIKDFQKTYPLKAMDIIAHIGYGVVMIAPDEVAELIEKSQEKHSS